MKAIEYYRDRIVRTERSEILPAVLWLAVAAIVWPNSWHIAFGLLGAWYAAGAAERIAGEPARDGNWEFVLTRSFSRADWFRAQFWPGVAIVAAFSLIAFLAASVGVPSLLARLVAEDYPALGEVEPIGWALRLLCCAFPILVYSDVFYFTLREGVDADRSMRPLGAMFRVACAFLVIELGARGVIYLVRDPSAELTGALATTSSTQHFLFELLHQLTLLGGFVLLLLGYFTASRGAVAEIEIVGAEGARTKDWSSRPRWAVTFFVLLLIVIVVMLFLWVLPAGGPVPR